MGRLAGGAALLVIGTLIIALFYWEPEWLTQWTDYERTRQWILLGGLILCGAGLALATYAAGFAMAEGKYTWRITSLTERVEEKKRALRELSWKLEREKRELVASRRKLTAARNKVAAKKKQLAIISGRLGDKEKRLKMIRKVAGA